MHRDRSRTNLGEGECSLDLLALFAYREFPASPIRVGETIIAVATLEAGVSRLLCMFSHAPEEMLKCLVKSPQHILQHMGRYLLVLFAYLCLDLRKVILLGSITDRQFPGQLLAGLLIIVVRVLLHVEGVRVPSFDDGRSVYLSAPRERPE